jgi:hypothetical protein
MNIGSYSKEEKGEQEAAAGQEDALGLVGLLAGHDGFVKIQLELGGDRGEAAEAGPSPHHRWVAEADQQEHHQSGEGVFPVRDLEQLATAGHHGLGITCARCGIPVDRGLFVQHEKYYHHQILDFEHLVPEQALEDVVRVFRNHLGSIKHALELLLQQLEQNPETKSLRRLLAVKKSLQLLELRRLRARRTCRPPGAPSDLATAASGPAG